MREIDIDCGANDVLASSRLGYHFTDRVEVHVTDASLGSNETRDPTISAQPGSAHGFADGETLNERQRWILDQIEKGVRLRFTYIVAHTKKNRSTVNRDLRPLRRRLIDLHENGYYVRANATEGT